MNVLIWILEWGAGIAFAVWTFTVRPLNAARQKQARRGQPIRVGRRRRFP